MNKTEGASILVVDDDRDIVNAIEKLLAREGYRIYKLIETSITGKLLKFIRRGVKKIYGKVNGFIINLEKNKNIAPPIN